MLVPSLRLAAETDLPAINAIYNYFVTRSTCTFQLEPETMADRTVWFSNHSPDRYPIVVAEIDNQVVGWGSLSKFHSRAGYIFTVEVSVYIRHDQHRRGLGLLLLSDLIARASQTGFRSIIGLISADQPASVALHQRLGFRQVGHLREVGYKFGQHLDVLYLQLMLGN